MKVTIKRKQYGRWEVKDQFEGALTKQLLRFYIDTDTALEIRTEKGGMYLCGKERYALGMREKGRLAMLFEEVIPLLDYPEHLERVINLFGEIK